MNFGRWQFVWWGPSAWQGFGRWSYPQSGRVIDFKIFDGWLFGLFEIRRMT